MEVFVVAVGVTGDRRRHWDVAFQEDLHPIEEHQMGVGVDFLDVMIVVVAVVLVHFVVRLVMRCHHSDQNFVD